jgi:hypothetical protein
MIRHGHRRPRAGTIASIRLTELTEWRLRRQLGRRPDRRPRRAGVEEGEATPAGLIADDPPMMRPSIRDPDLP